MKITDSTVARIAGNLLSGTPVCDEPDETAKRRVAEAVQVARWIVERVEETTLPESVQRPD